MEVVLLIALIALFFFVIYRDSRSNEKIDKTVNEISDLNISIEKIRKALDDYAKKKDLKEKIENIDSSVDKVKKSLYQQSTSTDTKLDSIKKSISDLSKSVSELKNDINSEIEAINVGTADALTSAENSIKELEKSLKEVKFYTVDIDKDVERLASVDSEIENKIIKESIQNNDLSALDPEQLAAFNLMQDSNENLFITGKAGTGKSFLLKRFAEGSKKRILVLAPTGIAAMNVGGATIHSAFGYPNIVYLDLNSITLANLRLKSEKKQVLKNVNTIIIDEISMVRPDVLEKIDRILKVLNDNNKPFGGKQLILFGDVFQLPPIARKDEIRYLKDTFGGIHFFNSNAYKNGNFKFIELTVNHRQEADSEFFDMLNQIREGNISDKAVELLHSRYTTDEDKLKRITRLFPTKAEAESINARELQKLNTKKFTFKSELVYSKDNMTPNIDAIFPISETLELKQRAIVMFVSNDPQGRWVNGTLGVISDNPDISNGIIKVKISKKYANGDSKNYVYEVHREEFSQSEAIYENGVIKYETVLTVSQFPIVLAYAMTIHKSQGMTYESIACDISECFVPGQAYVALSRCTTLDGLHLLKRIDKTVLSVDDDVRQFYLSQQTKAE